MLLFGALSIPASATADAGVSRRSLRSHQPVNMNDLNQLLASGRDQLDSWELKCTERRRNIADLREGAASRVAAADARVGDLSLSMTQVQAYTSELTAKFQLLKTQRREHLKACNRSETSRAEQHVLIRDSKKMLDNIERVAQKLSGPSSANVATVRGAMEDAKARNADGGSQRAALCRTRIAAIDEEARAIVSSQRAQASRLKFITADSAIALETQRNATADADSLRDLQARREGECLNMTQGIQNRTRELRQRRADALRSGGLSPIVTDCEVTPWHDDGTCNVTCGGGSRRLVREVLRAADGGMSCPSMLATTTTCNMQPCPTDCAIGEWGNWTNCSNLCDGGQRSRRRTVQTFPFGGGKPCPSTVDMEACNMQPCDDGCTYEGWKSWGSCSKACGGGVRTRTRRLNTTASVGGLSCPMHEGEEEVCQQHSCPVRGQFRCGAYVDMAFLIDGSELLREEDFADQLTFASDIVDKFGVPNLAGDWTSNGVTVRMEQRGTELSATLGGVHGNGVISSVETPSGPATRVTWEWADGPEAGLPLFEMVEPPFEQVLGWQRASRSDVAPGPRVAVVKFGAAEPGGAAEVSPLTSDTGALQGMLAQETQGRGGLDISPALAMAGRLLQAGRADAPSTVVVLVQGDPDSPHLTAQKSKRLQEQGVRVVVIGVGEIQTERNLKSMASDPWQQNYFHADSWATLHDGLNQQAIDLCPQHPELLQNGFAVVRVHH